MKILICRNTDSGIVMRLTNLIRTLVSEGHEVVVASPKKTAFQTLIDMGCRFIEVSIERHGTNPFTDMSVYKRYRSILSEEKPDISLLYTTKPNIYCGMACRKEGVPVIMNITGMGSALGNKGLIQSLMIRLYKKACNGDNIRTMFFQNEESLEYFKNNNIGDPKLFRRLPGSGVDLDRYPLQPYPESDTVDFLFVSRVLKQKGIDQYIEAARIVRKDHPEAVFHVLGACSDDYKDILEEETRKGTIIYHGRVNNVGDYQKMSQCTIQPSYYPEGMSNVILEAASSGRAVITTDHSGCREGIDDGKSGFLFPVKDSQKLAEAVLRFLDMSVEERREMGLCGRRKMEKEFDVRFVINAYLEAIGE